MATKDVLKAELVKCLEDRKQATLELKEANSRDWKKFAEDLIAKLFARYNKGAKWLDWAKAYAEKNHYIYAPTGRRRNLYGVMAGLPSLTAALLRRAVNSPIQGTASDVTSTVARITAVHFYRYLKKFYSIENMRWLPGEALKLVHDATYAEVDYIHLLAYIHILQWAATYGVTSYYKRNFNFDFNIEPEIEIELGASEDAHKKWDWTDSGLEKIVRESLEDQVKIGTLEKDNVDKSFKRCFSCYRKPEIKAFLERKYPILGVS